MGFFDALFGRQKPVGPSPERLFAISTADLTLETDQHLTPAGKAALCFRGIASGPFRDIQKDLEALLQLAARDDGLTIRPYEDSFGYSWFIFQSKDFQSLVTTIHVASETLLERGYGTQLIFAIFGFEDDRERPVYFMYNYKRGMFYPFVPRPDSHATSRTRDNSEELRLSAALGKEMPMEPEQERWFAAWDLPF